MARTGFQPTTHTPASQQAETEKKKKDPAAARWPKPGEPDGRTALRQNSPWRVAQQRQARRRFAMASQALLRKSVHGRPHPTSWRPGTRQHRALFSPSDRLSCGVPAWTDVRASWLVVRGSRSPSRHERSYLPAARGPAISHVTALRVPMHTVTRGSPRAEHIVKRANDGV